MAWFTRREILGAHLKSNKNEFEVEDGGGGGVVSGKKKVNTRLFLSSQVGNLC